MSDRYFTAIILALIAAFIAYSSLLIRFDNLHYDLGRYLTFNTAPSDIVIVAIDEASLESIGRWPWSRIVHADLVNKLKQEQARVIGLDIIFSEPELSNPEADIVLAHAIEQAGNVVLPVLFEQPYLGSPVKQSEPITDLVANATALGHVHVQLDADGMARSINLWEGLGQARIQHFSQAVLQTAKMLPNDVDLFPPNIKATKTGTLNSLGLISTDARKVKFLGPPGHFQRISYIKVLTGAYPAHYFKDKIVLVGATAAGMGDVLPTPVSALLQPMPGVEFHANAIASMRSSNLIVNAPVWLTCFFSIVLAVLPLLFLPKLNPLKSLLAIIFYYFVIMVAAIAVPYFFNIWIAPAGVLVAILLAYPIWSWRKLDSAKVFLDSALQNLQSDLASLGVSANDIEYAQDNDLMRSRISNVSLASKFLRDLHSERRDTLSFISHDLRAPIGASIMLLNEDGNNKHATRIVKMLNHALVMADSFLQVSRAEMADASKFQEFDIISLLHQSIDDVYAVARNKNIKIDFQFSEESIWLRGDFGLLQRAVSNILLNAVKYSPQDMTVKVNLTSSNGSVSLQISDSGPGIAPDKVKKLFKRFSRIEGEHQDSEGSGLGLYFVDVTVKKHSGTVVAESELGNGTTFTIKLPLDRRVAILSVEREQRIATSTYDSP
ncbi:CHASE2 domain-containing protein [Methylotenera sp.]|uniref:CHASE2 domain-containing protein n=1 Tax=Methylotenera sp. TaxID=2051956 RepID=UPI002735CAA3|nr:CHASE2 domain-containing protein [Methylotenera sp.]MDP3210690.1 CHASE2 domain-containing protein [Methylotenera sp.]